MIERRSERRRQMISLSFHHGSEKSACVDQSIDGWMDRWMDGCIIVVGRLGEEAALVCFFSFVAAAVVYPLVIEYSSTIDHE